jgi:glycosyltransferase involved in cell wall biosynthesis
VGEIKMKEDTISIIIPVYNEERAVYNTLEELKNVLKRVKNKCEIIVVNDCSKDRTAEILDKISGIKVLTNRKNKGYGASLKRGIQEAKGKWIMITDADGTYPIKDIPRFLPYLQDYDMVIGARVGKHVSDILPRRIAKWFLIRLASYIAGQRIPDLNSGLRIFKRDIALRFWSLFPEKFSFTSTITLACMTNGYDVKYIPINYYKRKGKSTIHPIKDFVGFTQLIIRIVTYFKPLNVFLPICLFFILLGAVKAVLDVINTTRIGAAAVVVILAGVQIGFLGLLADLIIKRTKL